MHSFFDAINWDKLEAREITPPFVPEIHEPGDCSYFDEFDRPPLENRVIDPQ